MVTTLESLLFAVILSQVTTGKMVVVAHAFNSSTLNSWLAWSTEFPDSQSHTKKPCLEYRLQRFAFVVGRVSFRDSVLREDLVLQVGESYAQRIHL